MTHIGLFEGIGGFSLAAKWMGWDTIAWCEWNIFCQNVLKKNFPTSIAHEDITKTNFTEYANKIDIVTGGFPCQPYSVSGKREGKNDDRHLWPEMLRAIREIQPSWVVGENVSGLLNWNGGMVLSEIKTDLESAGFEVFPPCVLPACGVNAPHRRDRVWIIAYSHANEHNRTSRQDEREGKNKGIQKWDEMELVNKSNGLRTDANANSIRQQRREQRIKKTHEQRYDKTNCTPKELRYSRFEDILPTPRIFGADDGLSNGVDRVKSLGNAIVPQVAYQIFKSIEFMNCKNR